MAAAAPEDLAAKARTGVLAGERKPVTVLFADVVGSTAILEQMDAEEWTAVINEGLEVMSRAVYRYEGTVARLMGDGLLAFFGAPVAHEDDPERAVRAGLDAIDDLGDLARRVRDSAAVELQIRVGVNTGPVIVGSVGSELMYEYTAIGDAVNVAARMQDAARPGTVTITEATGRFVAPRFELRDLGPLELKGRLEPVHGLEVVGPRAEPGPIRGIPGIESPLIGRAAELAELESALDALQDGHARAALVLGEAGIGKSRLLAEFRARARRNGGPVWAEGRCLSYGRTLPYHLLLDLLRSVLGVPEEADDDVAAIAVRAQLEGLLGAGWQEVYPPLGHLLSLPLRTDETGAIDRLEPRARHERYLAAVGAMLAALAARRPMILVCEDVHWADPASAAALRELLPSLGRGLLVCTARPEPDAPGWELVDAIKAGFGDACLELGLRPLSPDESRTLVGALLEVESLPAPIRGFILQKAEGNPFFLEEVVRMLIDHGAIERRGELWVGRADAPALELPESIHGLLLGRIDRLDEEARRAARVASVIGRRFDAPLLAEVLGKEVRGLIDHLVSAGIVVTAPSEAGEEEHQFRHVLLQEAAYDSILRRDRGSLHRSVAEALERLYPERRAELAAVLALHFERAGEVDRAVACLVEAGEHALARFAVHEARELLDRAAAHLADTDDPERRRLRIRVDLARIQAGWTFMPYATDLAILEELLPAAERLGEDRLVAETHLWIVRHRLVHGENPEASPALRTSLAEARRIEDTLGDDHLRALPLTVEAESRFGAGDYRGAIALYEEAVPVLEDVGDYTQASVAAGTMAAAAARLGDFARADEWVARAADLAERSGDPHARLDHHLFEGMIASERGDLERGLDVAWRGTEEARRVDNKACEVVGSFVVGEQALRAGRSAQAIAALERSTEVAQYCEALNVENLAKAWLSVARSQAGDPQEALASLAAALDQAREMGDPMAEGQILHLRGTVRARAAEVDLAATRADLEAALAVFRDLGTRPHEARALRDLGLVLRVAGHTQEAAEVLGAAETLFRQMGLAEAASAEAPARAVARD